ncbi:hypothetical protein C8R44DRAFT_990936 [Mycena epipterygia]|nr:hypothetical protein C8R44DRAFT_990936 [Mycena epipterygia]
MILIVAVAGFGYASVILQFEARTPSVALEVDPNSSGIIIYQDNANAIFFGQSIALSVVTNFVLMGLTGRIFVLGRAARRVLGDKIIQKYCTVSTIILESGMLYCAGALPFALMPFLSGNAAYYMTTGAPVLAQLVGIAPTIIAIQELVALVCSHLKEPRVWEHKSKQPEQRDLAVVARTCTAFLDPALDTLWSSATLRNLLCCLPSDVWTMVEVTGQGQIKYSMKLRRSIRPSDWERVHVYAPRVKHLFCFSHSDDCRLSDVFPTISVCLPENMFHNVQSLHWWPSDNHDFHYIHLFLGPRITSISFDPSSIPALSLLCVLAPNYRKLKTVVIRWVGDNYVLDEPSPELQQAISLFVRSLQCLESLSVNVLDTEALEHICRLPSLTSLNLAALSASSVFTPTDTQSFLSLSTLNLGSSEIEPTLRFLGGLKQIPLTSFNVLFPDFSTAAEIHDLYTAVAAAFSPSSLTDLALDHDSNFDAPDAATYAVQSRSVRILFPFVNLTSISILSPIEIDLDNATVADLARAWPRIESLDMSSYFCTSPRPRPTLESLHSFAIHCPHLKRLAMTLDCTVVPKSDFGATNRVCQQRLRTLDVDHSSISTAIGVARFLSGIFPNLRDILTQDVAQDHEDLDEVERQAIEFHFLWNQVEELLPDIAAILEEERVSSMKNVSGS